MTDTITSEVPLTDANGTLDIDNDAPQVLESDDLDHVIGGAGKWPGKCWILYIKDLEEP